MSRRFMSVDSHNGQYKLTAVEDGDVLISDGRVGVIRLHRSDLAVLEFLFQDMEMEKTDD